MGWSAGTENHLDVIQWDGNLGYFNLTNTPTFVSLSAVTLSADTIYSGNTNLYNIFSTTAGVTGSGTPNTIPMWTGTTSLGDSIMSYNGTGITVAGDVYITGDVEVLGTATTIHTQDLAVQDNTIYLNSGGTALSATGGGIIIEDGVSNGNNSNWIIDANGNWSANTSILAQGLDVESGVMASGGTDLYNIFSTTDANDLTRLKDGINTFTGGTENEPTINVTALTIDNITVSGDSSFTSLSADTIYSGSTDLSSLFAPAGSDTNNFVTGFTYDNANLFTVSVNDGNNYTAIINEVTGLTVSGALSADTIYSGSTDLYDIFLTTAPDGDKTRVQPGINTFTGGTANEPTINVTALTIDNITVSGDSSFTSLSANTLYSGSTNLSDIFLTSGDLSGTSVSAGSNVQVVNVGNDYEVSVVSSPSFDDISFSGTADGGDIISDSLSATTISGGTIFSGNTDLYDIFLTTNDGNDITRVQPGTNITTGGTANEPIINLDNDIVLNSVSGNTLSGGTIYSGSTDLSDLFAPAGSDTNNFVTGFTYDNANAFTISVNDGNDYTAIINEVTGLTVSGALSADTIYSGSTDLYDIFLTTAPDGDKTRVQNGTNTFTGGTANEPTVNVTGLTIDNITVSGISSFNSLSATTIYSGSTDLYDIFSTTDNDDITRVQPGTNITTGGTANEPIINLVDNVITASLSANTISGGTIYSGSTDLSDLFAPFGSDTNSYVTGFTYDNANAFTVSVNDGNDYTAVINEVTGLTVSGSLSADTIYSGSTDLYDIFLTTNDGNDITRVQPGTNITTGGTANEPSINVVDSPSFNQLTTSGQTTIKSNLTVTGNTIVSGTTTVGNDIEPNFDNVVDLGAPSFRWREIYTTNVDATNAISTNSLYAGFQVESPSISGTSVSATTIYSGSTDLYDIFLTTNDGNDITRVQPGTNITTGGTANEPVINLADDVTTASLSATTLSGGTIYSGSTDLSSIFALAGSDTNNYVTGFTYDNANAFTVSVNDGNDYTAVINEVTGLTVSGGLTASTLSADTIYSGSTDLSDLFLDWTLQTDFNAHTGDTNNPHSVTAAQVGAYTTSEADALYNTKADLSGATFTGGVIAPSLSATTLSGGTIYSGSTDLSSIFALAGSDTNNYVTGFTYDNANAFTVSVNDGNDYTAVIDEVTGLTVSGALSATTIYSGSTDLSDLFLDWTLQADFNSHTGDTNNPHSVTAAQVGAYTTSEADALYNTKANLSGATFTGGVIAPSLSATTLSGGTIYSGSTDLYDIFALAGSDTNTYVTGFTYDNANAFTVSVNDGNDYTAVINEVTGLTVSGGLTASTLSADTIYSGSTDLSDLFLDWTLQADFNSHTGDTNNPHSVTAAQVGAYTTSETDNLLNTKADLSGATFTGGVITPSLSATTLSGGTIYSGSTDIYDIFALAGTDTNNYVTGFTYDNANALTVSVNDGNDYTAVIDQMTGLTVNGSLSATTIYSGSTDLSDLFLDWTLQTDFNAHTGDTNNPHSVTAAQVGAYTTSQTDNLLNTKADLSGATFTGGVIAPSLSATTLSGGTIYSGSTELGSIFSTTDTNLANTDMVLTSSGGTRTIYMGGSSSSDILTVQNVGGTGSIFKITGNKRISFGDIVTNNISVGYVGQEIGGISSTNQLDSEVAGYNIMTDTSNFSQVIGLQMSSSVRTGALGFKLKSATSTAKGYFVGGTTLAGQQTNAMIEMSNTDKRGHWLFRTQVHLGDAERTIDTNLGEHTLIQETGTTPTTTTAGGYVQYAGLVDNNVHKGLQMRLQILDYLLLVQQLLTQAI
jgi:hypothetical protein